MGVLGFRGLGFNVLGDIGPRFFSSGSYMKTLNLNSSCGFRPLRLSQNPSSATGLGMHFERFRWAYVIKGFSCGIEGLHWCIGLHNQRFCRALLLCSFSVGLYMRFYPKP